jgi:hypothetical protein
MEVHTEYHKNIVAFNASTTSEGRVQQKEPKQKLQEKNNCLPTVRCATQRSKMLVNEFACNF